MSNLIIPVIDLLHGQVVHARGGRRADYRPVHTPLCPSSAPVAVMTALLALHPFSLVYVADLGALLGSEPHDTVLEELCAVFPGLMFWVDRGELQPALKHPRTRSVIGTESGISALALVTLTASGADFILSLDFNAAGLIGDAEILERAEHWPRDVIIMNLPGVGTARGPAWPIIDDIIGRAPNRNFYLAGGVRDAADVVQAMTRGMRGALVATALHTGTLDLSLIPQAKKTPA